MFTDRVKTTVVEDMHGSLGFRFTLDHIWIINEAEALISTARVLKPSWEGSILYITTLLLRLRPQSQLLLTINPRHYLWQITLALLSTVFICILPRLTKLSLQAPTELCSHDILTLKPPTLGLMSVAIVSWIRTCYVHLCISAAISHAGASECYDLCCWEPDGTHKGQFNYTKVYSETSEQRTLWGQAICPL